VTPRTLCSFLVSAGSASRSGPACRNPSRLARSDSVVMSRGSRHRTGYLWAAVVVIAVCGAPSLLYPFGRDQAMFAHIADRWMHGDLPYRDAWDIKPPGVFLAYAAALRLFGRSAIAPRAADLLVTILAAACLYALACRQGDRLRAALAAALFGMVYFTFGYWETAQVEGFAAPVAVALVYSLLEAQSRPSNRWWAVAGMCLGILVVLKTSFLLFALLAVVPARSSLRRGQRPWAGLGLFVAAAALPAALTALYFAQHRALGYLAELLSAQLAYAQGDIGGNLQRSVADWAAVARQPTVLLCLVPACLAPLGPRTRQHPDYTMVLSWLGISAAVFAGQQRFALYHALPMLPPLALLASGPLSSVLRAASGRRSLPARLLSVAGVAIVVAAILPSIGVRHRLAVHFLSGRVSPQEYWAHFPGMYDYSYGECVLVAEHVRARTQPDDPILVYAFEPAIYFIAQRHSPTRHLSTAPIFGETQIPRELREQWLAEQLQDVAVRAPRYLITVGCLHCARLTTEHGPPPEEFSLAGHLFRREAHTLKFTVYRRMDAPPVPGALPPDLGLLPAS
jgi:hypothetical protein